MCKNCPKMRYKTNVIDYPEIIFPNRKPTTKAQTGPERNQAMKEELALLSLSPPPFYEKKAEDCHLKIWFLSNNRHLIWCKEGEIVTIGNIKDVPQRVLALCFSDSIMTKVQVSERESPQGQKGST